MPKRKTAAGKSRGKRRGERAARPGAAASRTRAIEATLADIAHEIRTPLTGILALGELLTTSELGERERGWAAAIKSTAEHLALLTSLIVDAARADAKGLVLRRELIRPRRFADMVAASLCRPRGGQGHCGRGRPVERAARGGDRRSLAVAGGAGKSDRQCGEIHRSWQREPRRDQRDGGARKGAARLHRVRQRHRAQPQPRSSGCFDRSRRRARPSRAATAAPDSVSPSSSGLPKPWGAI